MNPDDFPAPKEGFVITHVHLIEVGQATGLLS
jgi:hypothetical protein